jgi:branched-chain amino acid transport system ATP-binding protein
MTPANLAQVVEHASERQQQAAPGARLEVTGLTKAFYGVRALDQFSFAVGAGELVGLIGPNGSGKTTAIDCISGFQNPDAGSVTLDGESIYRKPPYALVQRGLLRTFQSVRVFPTLSVRGNLRTAALARLAGTPRLRALLHRDRYWPGVDERIDELLQAFAIAHHANTPAGALSYGQRKLVEFAAACIYPPRMLLLDEPVAAVNPTIINVIRDWITRMNEAGTTILLVEHNIELVVGLCQRVIVLDHGLKIADGDPNDVMRMSEVQEAYFGR